MNAPGADRKSRRNATLQVAVLVVLFGVLVAAVAVVMLLGSCLNPVADIGGGFRSAANSGNVPSGFQSGVPSACTSV